MTELVVCLCLLRGGNVSVSLFIFSLGFTNKKMGGGTYMQLIYSVNNGMNATRVYGVLQ